VIVVAVSLLPVLFALLLLMDRLEERFLAPAPARRRAAGRRRLRLIPGGRRGPQPEAGAASESPAGDQAA
jgi:hypothetical protein